MKRIIFTTLAIAALSVFSGRQGHAQQKSRDDSGDDDGNFFHEFHANPGTWNAIVRNDKMYIQFAGFHWNEQRSFSTAELGVLPEDKTGSFTLKREAGTIVFTGVFSNRRGQGTYSFEEDPAFKSYLGQQGFTNIKEELMLHLFFTNINKEYFDYLKSNHYDAISMSQLKDLAEQNVNRHSLQNYFELFAKDGYGQVPLNTIVKLREHGVDAEFVSEFHEMGYKDVPLEMALRLRDHGVSPEFIGEFKKMGVKDLSLDEAIRLRDHGVDPEFIHGFEELGYKDISIEKATELRDHGVSVDYIKEFQDLGYKDISLDRARELRDHGVSPGFVSGFKGLGFTTISLEKAQELVDHGVTVEFVKRMQKKGINNLTLEEYEHLRDSGM